MSRSVPTDTLPPTARAIALLLASEPTIQDAQPGVLHQLLEFSHRYTSQVLSDALVYAEHAGRAGKIEMEDVVLAIQARVGWEFGGRVPKEVRSTFCSFEPSDLTVMWVLFEVHGLLSGSNECHSLALCTGSLWCPPTLFSSCPHSGQLRPCTQ